MLTGPLHWNLGWDAGSSCKADRATHRTWAATPSLSVSGKIWGKWGIASPRDDTWTNHGRYLLPFVFSTILKLLQISQPFCKTETPTKYLAASWIITQSLNWMIFLQKTSTCTLQFPWKTCLDNHNNKSKTVFLLLLLLTGNPGSTQFCAEWSNTHCLSKPISASNLSSLWFPNAITWWKCFPPHERLCLF